MVGTIHGIAGITVILTMDGDILITAGDIIHRMHGVMADITRLIGLEIIIIPGILLTEKTTVTEDEQQEQKTLTEVPAEEVHPQAYRLQMEELL